MENNQALLSAQKADWLSAEKAHWNNLLPALMTAHYIQCEGVITLMYFLICNAIGTREAMYMTI